MKTFDEILSAVERGDFLSQDDMLTAMDFLLEGEAPDEKIEAFLLALRARGETIDEIVAAAEAMRARAIRVSAPPGSIDTCGTGGDGADTYNISTAAALIVAGSGVPVAKHGNRSASSRSGSSDVLTALGVNIHATPALIERCLDEAKIGFMFAAYHHRAVGNVARVRKKLGVRTIFNALGPLANPAGARLQLMGVYDYKLTNKLAHSLGALGAHRAWVVAGADGLDELTTTGVSFVSEYANGEVRDFTLSPQDAGIGLADPLSLKGGNSEQNADALRRLLDGEHGAYRDIAVYNAAAALLIAGKSNSLEDAANLAAKAIDTGAAARSLQRLIEISNETINVDP